MQVDTDTADLTYVRVHEDDMRHRAHLDHREPQPRRGAVLARLPRHPATPGRDRDHRPHGRGTLDRAGPARARDAAPLPGRAPVAVRRPAVPLQRPVGQLLRPGACATTGCPWWPAFATVTPAFFATVMVAPHTTAELWPGATPTEADLHDFLLPLDEGAIGAASMAVGAAPYKVDVVVHRRGLDAIAGADVRVTLLQWRDPDVFALELGPAQRHHHLVPGQRPVDRGGQRGAQHADRGRRRRRSAAGWSFVGTNAATRRRSPDDPLDNVNSGVVTFDLDFTGAAQQHASYCSSRRSAPTAPRDLAAATLRNLTLGNPHVAVRSLRVQP